MSISTSLNSVKIRNNTIDIGHSSNGSTPITYTYDSALIKNYSDATISGNTLSGCFGNGDAATNLINIMSGSCIITNNIFVRGTGSPIAAYVNNAGTNDQIIVNNIFDFPNVDGSSTTLISGLTSASIYDRNLNQIKSYLVFNIQSVDLASSPQTTTSSSITDITGMTITVPNCLVGDIIDIGSHIYMSNTGSAHDGNIYITTVDGATTTIESIMLNYDTTSLWHGGYSRLYTVLNDGSVVVKMQFSSLGGTTGIANSTYAKTSLKTITYRH
jgi:hypothetical protein